VSAPHDHSHHQHGDRLNPLLAQMRFCLRCGAPDPHVAYPRHVRCDACGFVAFFNPKPVACALALEDDGRIWLARRGFDPSKGRWAMPGGFVDLGESAEDALRRELREELAVDATVGSLVGVYSRHDDRTLVVVFRARLHGAPQPSDEAPEVRAFAPAELPWDELGFWSDEAALRDLLSPPA
jgi:ADP-ribose pyrophosphatase YjhB (NUDIX family)